MNNKILTFEWDDKHQKLEIHGNIEGIASLIKYLQKLLTPENQDHVHLLAPSLGGDDLTEVVQGKSNKLISNVKIFVWD